MKEQQQHVCSCQNMSISQEYRSLLSNADSDKCTNSATEFSQSSDYFNFRCQRPFKVQFMSWGRERLPRISYKTVGDLKMLAAGLDFTWKLAIYAVLCLCKHCRLRPVSEERISYYLRVALWFVLTKLLHSKWPLSWINSQSVCREHKCTSEGAGPVVVMLCSLLRLRAGKGFLTWFMHGCGVGLTSTKMNSSTSSSASTPSTWSTTTCVSTPTTTRGWCHQESVGQRL